MNRPKLGETGKGLGPVAEETGRSCSGLATRKESGYFAEADRDGGVSGRRIALAKLGDRPIGMDL